MTATLPPRRPDLAEPGDSRTDRHGIDSHGLDSHGLDGHGIDGHGIDGHGIDGHGIDDDGLSVLFSLSAVERRAHRVPNLLIAGVSHAGVDGLRDALGRHTEVALPTKRLHRYTPLRYGRAVETGLSDYDRLFVAPARRAPRYRLETSPGYFDGGRSLVETVNRELPGLRVVVVLRDPAERLWASYSDKVARGRVPEGLSFESFVERGLTLSANGCHRFESNRHFRTLASGHYVDHLATWLDVFGRRLRIVFAEDLEATPTAGVTGLYDWLDLDPTDSLEGEAATPPAMVTTTDGEGLQSFGDDVMRRGWPVLTRPAGTWRPAGMASGLRRAARPFLPRQGDRVRAKVEAMYAAPNRDLAAMLRDRGLSDLPRWLTHA
jgi:hypothetical protein